MKPHILKLALLCALSSSAFAQQFNISPASPVLLGEPIAVTLNGLLANQDIKLSAERVMTEWGGNKRVVFRSEASFKADANGALDLAGAAPKSGSYKGADARGLFWSMKPVKGDVPADRKMMEVRLQAHTADDKLLAESVISMIESLPGVKTEPVAQFPGALFALPPSTNAGKVPAIILLGGSEGGSIVTRGAAQLASHGFAVLALPYYSPVDWQTGKAELPSLPAPFADIPVERLNEAYAWLKTRSEVDAARVALHGTSKGAEFALLAGVHLSWMKSVVAIVPTDVVWEGWGPGIEPGKRASFALNGKPFAFVPYKEFAEEFMGFQTGADVRIRRPQDKGRAAYPAAAVAARIPVEKIKAPVMVVAGQEDQVWNSAMMAHNIAERRAEARLDTVSLIYIDAGHYLTGTGYSPTTQYNLSPMKGGGTPEGNAKAQADAWPKTIAFLKRTLGVK